MSTNIIILICAGGLFVCLLFFYMLVGFERLKRRKRAEQILRESYIDANIKKMDYDVAFYDEEVEEGMSIVNDDVQVTFDDLLGSPSNGLASKVDAALFTHIENDGVKEIVGHYNPEKDR